MDTLPSLPDSHRTPKNNLPGEIAASRSLNGNELWRVLRKRWLPAVMVAGTIFGGVTVFTLTRTPLYRSETLILLDKETNDAAQINLGDNAAPAAIDTSKDLSTEIEILKSRPLVSKALKTLEGSQKDISVEAVGANLSVRQAGEADVLIVSYTDTDAQRVKAVLEALGWTYVNYSLQRKRSEASSAIQFIEAKLPDARQALNKSASALRVFRQRHGLVDPNTYAASLSETKQSLLGKTSEAKTALDQSKRQEQVLRRQMVEMGQNPETALAHSALSQDTTYQKLVNQLRQLEIDYADKSIHYQDNHPALQDLKTARSKTLKLMERQAQRVLGSQLPKPKLERQTTSASNSLQQDLARQLLQIQADLAVRTTQLSSLRQAAANMSKRFQQVPELQQTYAELQREFSLNSKEVDRFLERLQELRIIEAQKNSPWRILEPPYLPTQPISPNIKRSLILGLIAGGLLGIAIAVLLERWDCRLKEVEEVKELTGLPLLGAIPQIDRQVLADSGGKNGLFRRHDLLPFTEALRSLALNLKYLGSSGQAKTFAFTSAFPAEGKSTITYYLGLVLAELGQRVLIVDGDMRNPSIHKIFGGPNGSGFSTAIATDCPWRELIHSGASETLALDLQTTKEITPAVMRNSAKASISAQQRYHTTTRRPDILTSGPVPPNPLALLGSQKTRELLQEWRQAYDYVLIDTPPIVGITDAQSIAAEVDGMILIAAIEHSTRPAIQRALEILEGTHCNMAGLVVNLLNKGHETYHYYQYYASYYSDQAANNNGNGMNANGHAKNHKIKSRS